jgi:hypothetical protein
MHGEMNTRHSNSFNRMKKKRNVKGRIRREIYGRDS